MLSMARLARLHILTGPPLIPTSAADYPTCGSQINHPNAAHFTKASYTTISRFHACSEPSSVATDPSLLSTPAISEDFVVSSSFRRFRRVTNTGFRTCCHVIPSHLGSFHYTSPPRAFYHIPTFDVSPFEPGPSLSAPSEPGPSMSALSEPEPSVSAPSEP